MEITDCLRSSDPASRRGAPSAWWISCVVDAVPWNGISVISNSGRQGSALFTSFVMAHPSSLAKSQYSVGLPRVGHGTHLPPYRRILHYVNLAATQQTGITWGFWPTIGPHASGSRSLIIPRTPQSSLISLQTQRAGRTFLIGVPSLSFPPPAR
ncbi:hypothetical protein FA95DRAFT_1140829 [Auriscalpium vulgare]|uniref:Uncharacterized protein n=1 Tax=Auriscalpium vulgare TaxID=40419 RepID=A0ACB8RWM1_9AGAM|nr:hypothetical protein FA95DRAFT_1140829 [Auriscalpium vulgare]